MPTFAEGKQNNDDIKLTLNKDQFNHMKMTIFSEAYNECMDELQKILDSGGSISTYINKKRAEWPQGHMHN